MDDFQTGNSFIQHKMYQATRKAIFGPNAEECVFHLFIQHDGKASAIVETCDGRVRVLPLNQIQFTDKV